MPELPEVEIVRRGVQRGAVGRTVADATVLHPRSVRRHLPGSADLAARLAGRTFANANRRGKYLWLTLAPDDDGEALLVHLGMSGQLLVVPPDSPPEPHLRVRLRFTDEGRELRFVDQRTFGHVMTAPLVPDLWRSAAAAADRSPPGVVPAPIAHIAPDPMEPAFDPEGFAARLRRRDTGVKRALLDQSLVSGIGNIYADEALWRARLHWARPTRTLRRGEVDRIVAEVRAVMTAALAAGGTSFDALYVDVNGRSGWFDRSLAVYGQADRPCPRCGTPVRRDRFMNRSAFTCPRCQPRPRNARW
jgi:formamidopyrimidine-DNA glycosylase